MFSLVLQCFRFQIWGKPGGQAPTYMENEGRATPFDVYPPLCASPLVFLCSAWFCSKNKPFGGAAGPPQNFNPGNRGRFSLFFACF